MENQNTVEESTLESEIDALSKMITDTKDITSNLSSGGQDYKLNSDDVIFSSSDLHDDELGIKDILDSSGEIDSFISATDSSFRAELNEILKTNEGELENTESKTSKTDSKIEMIDKVSSEDGENKSKLNIKDVAESSSSSLINKAYTSQESQSCSESPPEATVEIQESILKSEKEQHTTEFVENVESIEVNKNIEKASEVEECLNESLSETKQNETADLQLTETTQNLSSTNLKQKLEDLEENDFCSKISDSRTKEEIAQSNPELGIEKSDLNLTMEEEEMETKSIEDDLTLELEDEEEEEEEQSAIESNVQTDKNDSCFIDKNQQSSSTHKFEELNTNKDLESKKINTDSNQSNLENVNQNLNDPECSTKDTDFSSKIDSALPDELFSSEKNEEKNVEKNNLDTKKSSRILDEVQNLLPEKNMDRVKSNAESISDVSDDTAVQNELLSEHQPKPKETVSDVINIVHSMNSESVTIEETSENEKESSTVTHVPQTESTQKQNEEKFIENEFFRNVESTDDFADNENSSDNKSVAIQEVDTENMDSVENVNNVQLESSTIDDIEQDEISQKEIQENVETEPVQNPEDNVSDLKNLPANESNYKTIVSEGTDENLVNMSVDLNFEPSKVDDNDVSTKVLQDEKKSEEDSQVMEDIADTKSESDQIELSLDDIPNSDTEKEETLAVEKKDKESEPDVLFQDSLKDADSEKMEDFDQSTAPELNDVSAQENIESESGIELETATECDEPVTLDEKCSENNFDNKETNNDSSTMEGDLQFEETKDIETDNMDNDETALEISESEKKDIEANNVDNDETAVEISESEKKDIEANNVDNDETAVEISESEAAVKFLQESEENNEVLEMEKDIVVDDRSSIFVSVDDHACDIVSELAPDANFDPIAISEAEIISEAAKLENEKKMKLKLEQKLKNTEAEESSDLSAVEEGVLPAVDDFIETNYQNQISVAETVIEAEEILQIPLGPDIKLTSKMMPKTSVVEDRYKEPPMIEIPEDSSQIINLPSDTLKTSEAIDKETPQSSFDSSDQKTLSESKTSDVTRKDVIEKQQQQSSQSLQQYPECENVGSPRIILKIAKSAIADCSEPRSPKSPKIRSAANSPNPEDSPSHKLGKIKLKLSKGGHPSIIPSTDSGYDETVQWHTETSSMHSTHGGMKIKLAKMSEADRDEDEVKDKINAHKLKHKEPKETGAQETLVPKKQDSLGIKFKLSKSGDASIIQDSSKMSDDPKEAKVKDKSVEDIQDSVRRTESPLGMKIKLSKSGDASIISKESDRLDRLEMEEMGKLKASKYPDVMSSAEISDEIAKSGKSIKVKHTKTGDVSVEQPLGMMKIKLSKTGEPSIIYPEMTKETKHVKNKDHSIAAQQKSEDDSHLEMKIKLSKTGHPTIIASSDTLDESSKLSFITQSLKHKDHKDLLTFKETTLKELKESHSDVTIEPVMRPLMQNTMIDLHSKRKEISIAPVESKKSKLETSFKQMLPDITIQPVKREQQPQHKLLFDPKSGNISRQQMSVINREISITQVRLQTSTADATLSDKIRNLQSEKMSTASPLNSDCEIIDPQPELIIVNENSNSSQDIMIIDEVPSIQAAVKIPKKRGRPRRNAVGPIATMQIATPSFQEFEFARDPLSLDQPPMMMLQQHLPMQMQHSLQFQQSMRLQSQIAPGGIIDGNEPSRPRRTCRSQKSYAPPKRGRGRGRGKRKHEGMDIPMKKMRIDQDLTEIERSTAALISLEKLPTEITSKSPELFKALNQSTQSRESQCFGVDVKVPPTSQSLSDCEVIELSPQKETYQSKTHDTVTGVPIQLEDDESRGIMDSITSGEQISMMPQISNTEGMRKSDIVIKVTDEDEKQIEITESIKDPMTIQENQNWLAPSIKKVSSTESSMTVGIKSEAISTLTVIDEETRMSADSCSRSQTPARGVPITGGPEVLVTNEESQGSVLSTATTESEKVKVRIRRMEITVDPDDGPFTVEKIAEYEWPIERRDDRPAVRGETFMIQEQISQYLGVKSFKRKYPDLKRRMVDMEERNFLRENGLVSEAMCDMGLTAVSSSEVLDIMCSDFPEQYEEYRKHMREKAAKEHSKKQKELSAAANAERSRIDLAEMAVQSALAWNVGFNKARRDTRKCSLDLQTYTVHVPLKRRHQRKLDPNRRSNNNYPVALMPGQYAEYFREYTPDELRYYPLNTVLYGPMRPNERKFDSQSEGSQSDSDSDSSSDDSSSSSSEGTQDTEGSQSTMDEVDMELAIQSDIKCKVCSNNLNKNNRPEVLIQCGTCSGHVHPTCMDLTLDMVPHIRAYAWQCTDCKTCAQCHDPADEDKMLFCDMCDRGYHIYCVGLRRVPQGRWHCQECAVCANCGAKEPGGANSDRNSVAQWQHEYKKADKNTRVYVSTFCVPCSKLWRKGRYCPHCSRCHNAPRLDLEPNLVHCGACDKYLHLDCVEGATIDRRNYLCEFCSPNRSPLMKPLMSKTFKI